MPVRAFSREQFEEQRFDKANKDLMGTQLFTNRAMVAMMPFMTLIMNGTSLLIVWFGGKAMDAGTMQVGEMIAFITYTMQIVMSFLMLAMVAVMLPRAGVAADRIDEVIRTKATIHDPDEADAKAAKEHKNWQGVVEFHDVSFRFPGADSDALEHISFTAKPGETTAIIGSTGCGKSTLLNLIPRFYDVTGGSVTVDGIDVRQMPQAQLHDLLGYVPQKGVLFSGTIDSNLKFGGDHITDAAVKKAAAIAQATEFIDAKPEGYAEPHRPGRFQRVRRPETAPVHRPCHCQGPQNLSVRRQFLGPGLQDRRGPAPRPEGPDRQRHRPHRGTAHLHRAARKPDPGAGRGPSGGQGHPCPAHGQLPGVSGDRPQPAEPEGTGP